MSFTESWLLIGVVVTSAACAPRERQYPVTPAQAVLLTADAAVSRASRTRTDPKPRELKGRLLTGGVLPSPVARMGVSVYVAGANVASARSDAEGKFVVRFSAPNGRFSVRLEGCPGGERALTIEDESVLNRDFVVPAACLDAPSE